MSADDTATAAAEMAAADAFVQAARWFVGVVDQVDPDQWNGPGLGEWSVRELVGHAGRALVTVEEYLRPPTPGEHAADTDEADKDAVDAASRYFLGTHDNPTLHEQVAARGRKAGEELGSSPADTTRQMADRVVALVLDAPSGSVFATRFGQVGFALYLNTRTVEMVVHGLDIATACAIAVEVPPSPQRVVLEIMVGVARHRGEGAQVIAALGGRGVLPPGFNVLG